MTEATHDVARRLFKDGWSPLPLPARAKKSPPEGFTGYAGKYPTAEQIERWDWSGNIALRMPADVVGVDVDAYHGGELAPLEAEYGNLPPTVWSTSRDDGSGIALYRIPVGTTLRTNPRTGIDMIQFFHRYMVVYPSVHPEGRNYQWIDEQSGETLDGPPPPDELPDLPWGWIQGLAYTKTAAAAAASSEQVSEFIDAHQAATFPAAIKGIKTKLDNHNGSRHDTLVATACWALTEAAAGLYPAADAIDTLHGWWRRVMDDPERRDGGEFGDAICWAVAQVLDNPEGVEEARRKASTDLDGLVATPPPGIDPETGEIRSTVNLPDEFWDSRPVFKHIRDAAHSRMVSADAVLLAVLARVVMLTPPNITLPAIIGSRVSLNLFVSVIDASGGGKSAAVSVARELLPHQREDVADPILPSSGEGLIEAFMGMVEIEGDNGQKRKERKQVNTAGLAWVDEGQALLNQADRSGSTIMETIRSAWMGGDLGQHNATEERKRWLQAHKYRLSIIIGFQLTYAATLIADGEGGTPQRFTFALASDPQINPDAEWPGRITWTPQPTTPIDTDVVFDPVIVAGIRERRLERSRGLVKVDPLDTHADLRKMKLAAAVALLDGRPKVTVDDWEIASTIDDTSCRVRSLAVEHARVQSAQARRLATAIAVEREATVESAKVERTLVRVARNVARKVWRDGPMTPTKAYRVVHSRDRSVAEQDDVIAVAVDRGWLSGDGDLVTPGGQRP